MREFTLTDPLYGAEITLLVGGSIDDLARRTGEKDLIAQCPGYCIHSATRYDSAFFVWVESPALPLLCHELLHLTFTVLGDRGMSMCDESEEAYTYWFEAMLEQVEHLRILG